MPNSPPFDATADVPDAVGADVALVELARPKLGVVVAAGLDPNSPPADG